ncbi:hypothetical protein JHD50_10895 [Sulfurimonas sp. MAG313]|nr:hypothetical protein [Sulfurimonas sp. MAG313]MDF1881799.1 hypothetical protein [Sulfurimonas sp. MAG313]
MGTMMLLIGGALLFALITFWVCEEKSLKDANFSDMKCMVTEQVELSKCFEQFNTVRYMSLYFIIILIGDFIIANMIFLPRGFGLTEAMAFTFVPSILGSGIILLVKWTYQPMVKLISSFLFGSVFMGASIIAFGITLFVLA